MKIFQIIQKYYASLGICSNSTQFSNRKYESLVRELPCLYSVWQRAFYIFVMILIPSSFNSCPVCTKWRLWPFSLLCMRFPFLTCPNRLIWFRSVKNYLNKVSSTSFKTHSFTWNWLLTLELKREIIRYSRITSDIKFEGYLWSNKSASGNVE